MQHDGDVPVTAGCPVCGQPFGDEAVARCTACSTPHHMSCWRYAGGCSLFGCGGAAYHRAPAPASDPSVTLVPATRLEHVPSPWQSRLLMWLQAAVVAGAVSPWILFGLVDDLTGLSLVFAIAMLAMFLTRFLRRQILARPRRRELTSRLTLLGWSLGGERTWLPADETTAVHLDAAPVTPTANTCTVWLETRNHGRVLLRKPGAIVWPTDEFEARGLAARTARALAVPLLETPAPTTLPPGDGADETVPATTDVLPSEVTSPCYETWCCKSGFAVLLLGSLGAAVPLVLGALNALLHGHPTVATAALWPLLPLVVLGALMARAGQSDGLLGRRMYFSASTGTITSRLTLGPLPLPWTGQVVVEPGQASMVQVNRVHDETGSLDTVTVRRRDGTWRTLLYSSTYRPVNASAVAVGRAAARCCRVPLVVTADAGACFLQHSACLPDDGCPLGTGVDDDDGGDPPSDAALVPPGKKLLPTAVDGTCPGCSGAVPFARRVTCMACGAPHHRDCWLAGDGTAVCRHCGSDVGAWSSLAARTRQAPFVLIRFPWAARSRLIALTATAVTGASLYGAVTTSPLFVLPAALTALAVTLLTACYHYVVVDPRTRRARRYLVAFERCLAGPVPDWLDPANVAGVQLAEGPRSGQYRTETLWVVLRSGERRQVVHYIHVPCGGVRVMAERLARLAGTTVRCLLPGEAAKTDEPDRDALPPADDERNDA